MIMLIKTRHYAIPDKCYRFLKSQDFYYEIFETYNWLLWP